MNCRVTVAALLLAVALSLVVTIEAKAPSNKLLGVSPQFKRLYETDKFRCLNSGEQIPSQAINDDFCDCKDGTDEPGTSACQDGVFWCENRGYISKAISSAFVNDGICDCCDGSDEYADTKCENSCSKAGEEIRKQRIEEIRLHRSGARIKDEWIKWAKEHKQSLFNEVEEKKLQMDEADTERTKLKTELDSLTERKDKAQKVLDRQASEKDREDDEADEEKEPHEATDSLSADQLAAEFEQTYGMPAQDAVDAWERLDRDYSAANRKFSSRERDYSDAKKMTEADYGPKDEFYKLKTMPLDWSTSEYTYTANLFDMIKQGSTNMGNFDRWEGSDYKVQKYNGGQRCWGAGDRETEVRFLCGSENQILSVDEPNKCQYVMVIKTPAVCSKEYADELVAQLEGDKESIEKSIEDTASKGSGWW